jgi:hypothetical protein
VVRWFRRFGDIPGVTYETPSGLDPKKLPGYGVVPKISVAEFEYVVADEAHIAAAESYHGKSRPTLWWPEDGGGTSASPAKNRMAGHSTTVSTREILVNCLEALELPGEPVDYHFLIQHCADALWSQRRKEPDFLDDVEKLCWLDIQLIQARPDTVRIEGSDEPRFYHVSAFLILIDVYQREGFLREALDVAELAARYGQLDARDRLAKRITAVENEDRG